MFVDDLEVPHLRFGLLVRSPEAGRLVSIDCPLLGSSYTLVTAADIPGVNHGDGMEIPVLASERVSYIGEPVAILVGPHRAELEKYAAACRVAIEPDLDPPPPFFEERSVTLGGAPRNTIDGGPPDKKTVTVEGEYCTGIQDPWCVEPAGALAEWEENGIVIYTVTQWPSHVRASVAAVTGLAPEKVSVKNIEQAGVNFDARVWFPSILACQAALAAMVVKRPVKLTLTRQEDFLFAPKRAAVRIRFHSTLDPAGKMYATDIDVTAVLGAYGVFAPEILDRILSGAVGQYKLGLITMRGRVLRANIPPAGPFCGFGLSQGAFALERHVSRIADAVRMDGVEWRKSHLLKKNRFLSTPAVLSGEAVTLLDHAAAVSGYHRKWGANELLRRRNTGPQRTPPLSPLTPPEERIEPLRGIGIAFAFQGSGFFYTPQVAGQPCALSVTVTLETDGSLDIRCPIESAEAHRAIWKAHAARILSLEDGVIHFNAERHELFEDNRPLPPACLSAHIAIITALLQAACLSIKEQRFKEKLPISVTRNYEPHITQSVFNTRWDENALANLSQAAAVVEVELDRVECAPVIRAVWLSVDAGHIYSETDLRHVLTLSAIAALGWASSESIDYVDGKIDMPCGDYGLLSGQNIPPIYIDFIQSAHSSDEVPPPPDDTRADSLAQGVRELPFSTIPAAFAQAVTQAADLSVDTIPLDLRVLNALTGEDDQRDADEEPLLSPPAGTQAEPEGKYQL